MTIHKYKLRLISPAFVAGADKNKPEMRAASIRGQLRYWLRAFVGASTDSLEEIWKREGSVFGSTEGGSIVSVRVYRDSPVKIDDYPMLPHRSNEGRRGLSIQTALRPGQVYDLELVTRPGVPLPADALNALGLWSLLGGVGRRSRRMFGAIQVTTSEESDQWYASPQTPEELALLIRSLLTNTISTFSYMSLPTFPTLNPAHSWVIVGKSSYASQEELVISLFRDLLRSDRFRSNSDTFGQAMGGRRASPLIAQVKRIQVNGEDHYYPILTALRSKPDNRIDWPHLKLFMETAERHFNAERVWGGW